MRGLLGEIISRKAQMTIADMEAGLEHLSRSDGTLRHVDVILVVLEPYHKALETARRTRILAEQLGIPRIYGVANKVQGPDDERHLEEFSQANDLPIIGAVPYDDAARRADRFGTALIDAAPDSKAVAAIDRLLESIAAVPTPAA